MGPIPLILTGAFTLATCVWYIAYVRYRIDRESAFVYLVQRVVSKRIGERGLEEELKQIALERDEVELDRFDRLVKQCPILDIRGPISGEEMLRRAAAVLAPRLGLEEQKLYEMLLAREQESSTVLKPGLAIPHVVVDGEKLFDILLVRCKEGIVFSELNPPVTTAFVLLGSQDERNFHLKALMAIAHIVEEPDFEQRWLRAKNIEQLRDIVLLSSRKRQK